MYRNLHLTGKDGIFFFLKLMETQKGEFFNKEVLIMSAVLSAA